MKKYCYQLQVKITILNWTCLLIPLKYMENQEQSGQVQFRIVIFTCTSNIDDRLNFLELSFVDGKIDDLCSKKQPTKFSHKVWSKTACWIRVEMKNCIDQKNHTFLDPSPQTSSFALNWRVKFCWWVLGTINHRYYSKCLKCDPSMCYKDSRFPGQPTIKWKVNSF